MYHEVKNNPRYIEIVASNNTKRSGAGGATSAAGRPIGRNRAKKVASKSAVADEVKAKIESERLALADDTSATLESFTSVIGDQMKKLIEMQEKAMMAAAMERAPDEIRRKASTRRTRWRQLWPRRRFDDSNWRRSLPQ